MKNDSLGLAKRCLGRQREKETKREFDGEEGITNKNNSEGPIHIEREYLVSSTTFYLRH